MQAVDMDDTTVDDAALHDTTVHDAAADDGAKDDGAKDGEAKNRGSQPNESAVLPRKTVDAYLDRIGAPRVLALDSASLAALHRAHLLTVPFENLGLHLSEPVSLDQDDLIDKIVTRRRGGFCYELNGAFAMLLRSLGAQVTLVGARVHDGNRFGPPFDHLALLVRLADGSGPWVVDVGFGNHSDFPLLLEERGEQVDPGGRFRLVETEDGDVEVLKDEKPQYRIELHARSLEDFVPTCWWQQTSPGSHFTQSLICSRRTDQGRVSLSGRTLIVTSGGTRTEEELPTDDAVLAAYRDHLGVFLDRVPAVPAR
jgi:N-hydroxyarylamine O-acetyltransferase